MSKKIELHYKIEYYLTILNELLEVAMNRKVIFNEMLIDIGYRKFDIVKSKNFIFYNNDNGIFKYDVISNSTNKIIDGNTKSLNVINNELWFMKMDKGVILYKSDFEGNSIEQLYYKKGNEYHEVRYSKPYLYIYDKYSRETIERVDIQKNYIENLSIGAPSCVCIDSNTAYYSDSSQGQLKKKKTNIRTRVDLNECNLEYIKENNEKWFIYDYSSENNSIKLDYLNSKETIIYENNIQNENYNKNWGIINEIDLDENWVYFTMLVEAEPCFIENKFNLFRIKKDGSDLTILCKDNIRDIHTQGGWIYFIKKNYYNSLWRIRLDGSEEEVLDKNRCCNLEILDNDLYYFNKFVPKAVLNLEKVMIDYYSTDSKLEFDPKLEKKYCKMIKNDVIYELKKIKC